MYVYVARPEGFKYDLCTDGHVMADGSGLCTTHPLNASVDLLNSTLLSDLSISELLDSELSTETKSSSEGKII